MINLADALRDAGAQLFFHVDNQPDTKAEAEPEADSPVEGVNEDLAANAVPHEPVAMEDEFALASLTPKAIRPTAIISIGMNFFVNITFLLS